MIERVKRYHDQFIEDLKQSGQFDDSSEIDPLEAQMWHYLFDPHEVEEIPPAELKPHPKQFYQKNESIKDFLNKSNIQ